MIAELRKKIEDSDYWEARVKQLNCNYFGDEVELRFEDEFNEVFYHFEECYDVNIKHLIEYTKEIPSRELLRGQIPYFMQDVEIKEIEINNKQFLEFNINIYPLEVHIICHKFSIK